MDYHTVASQVAEGVWTAEHLGTANALNPDENRQLWVSIMHRASQFSPNAEEAQKCPLNSPTAFNVRRNALVFVSGIVNGENPNPLWLARYAEGARRFEESKIEGRLSFGKVVEAKEDIVMRGTSSAVDLVIAPRAAAEKMFTRLGMLPLSRDVRMLAGYEQAYWLGLDGKFGEAHAMYTQYARDCAGDNLGQVVFQMQAVKAGLDGKLPNAVLLLVGTYTISLSILQANRTDPLAKQWMEQTMPAHIDLAVAMDASLAETAKRLKANILLAREGKLAVPQVAGM